MARSSTSTTTCSEGIPRVTSSPAGGFRPDAALQRISVSRIVPPARRALHSPDHIVVDVPLRQMQDGAVPPFAVEPGDQITVFALGEGQRSVVELRGKVYLPGTYGWYPGIGLSELIRLGGGFRPAVYAGGAHIERLNPVDSTRFVFRVPLPADSGAPYPDDVPLQDYDIVTIYGREEFRDERTVTIAGMVRRADAYPYRNDMTLRDLVLMARGLRDGAYLDRAEVARLPTDRSRGQLAVRFRVPMDLTYLFERDSTTYRFVPGAPIADGAAPEFVLQPFDHVTILKQPGFELQRMVQITGELRFPGVYALERKDERLSDLVRRAGGLLPTAYPDGSRFMRTLDNAGRVNVDLQSALTDHGQPHDLILQPGDSVHVPEYTPIVRVIGAVNSPTSVRHERGKGFDYYIANAGGYSSEADNGRVSVRYADGSARVRSRFLLFTSHPEPGPGSTIVVPTRPPGEGGIDIAVLFGGIAQILSAITTMVLVIDRLAAP